MSHSTHQWAVRKMLLLFFLLSFFGLVAVRDKLDVETYPFSNIFSALLNRFSAMLNFQI
jgi:hypothetical protein